MKNSYIFLETLHKLPGNFDQHFYYSMFSEIKPEFRNLFHSLCEEQSLMYIQSDEVKERKRQRKVETEVADLKLKLATTHSKNIVLSNREIRLLRYLVVEGIVMDLRPYFLLLI